MMTCFINSHSYVMSVYTGVSYLEIKTQVCVVMTSQVLGTVVSFPAAAVFIL